MPYSETCPKCNRRLRIEEHVSSPWLTCPRCLAMVRNPGAFAPRAAPPAPGGPAAGAEAPKPIALVKYCPACWETIPREARICPLCCARLGVFGYRSTDDEVRASLSWAGRWTIPLVILGMLGSMSFLGGIVNFPLAGAPAFTAVVMTVFAVILAALGFSTRRERPLSIPRLVLGVLAVFGVLTAIPLALLIFFLASCFLHPPQW